MPLGRFIGLVLLGVGLLVILVVWFFPSTADFNFQNPFWNGLEGLDSKYEAEVLSSLAGLPADGVGSVLVVIPYREPGRGEIDQLKKYLNGGGTLLLADDYGFGNSLLESLGISASFTGFPLLDPLFNYRNRWFPLATNVREDVLTSGVAALALDYGTALQGKGLTVVASSSAFSYLDRNLNGKKDENEASGPFPVAGYIQVGRGQVVLVSDPSILINSMLGAEGNARFVANLVASLGPGARVYLAQGLLPPSNLGRAKGGLAAIRSKAASPGVLAVLTAGIAVVMLYPVWKRKGEVL